MKKGYVYLLQSKANKKLFKIGCSANIDQRLITLQNTSAGGIELIYLFEFEDMYAEEAYLKNFLKRHSTNGEWFDLMSVCKDIVSFKLVETIGVMYKDYMVEGHDKLEKYKKIIEEKGLQIKVKP